MQWRSQARGLLSLSWGDYRNARVRNMAIVCILMVCYTVVSLYHSILSSSQAESYRHAEPLKMTADLIVANKSASSQLVARPTTSRYARRPVDRIEDALRLPVLTRLGKVNVLGVVPHSMLMGWESILVSGSAVQKNGQMAISANWANEHGLTVGDHLSLAAINQRYGTQQTTEFEIIGLLAAEPLFSPIVITRDDLAQLGSTNITNVAMLRRSTGSDQASLSMWAKETYGDALYLAPETPSQIGLAMIQDQQSSAGNVLSLTYLFLLICSAAFAYMGFLSKTKELAILRAIGISGVQILWVFAIQSLLNVTLGLGLGQLLAALAAGYFQRRGLISGSLTAGSTAIKMAALVFLVSCGIPSLLAKSATISELLQSRRVPIWRASVSEVKSHDSVAVERERRDGVRILRLPTLDGIFEGAILKHPSDAVKTGEVLAFMDSFWGLHRKEWASPVDGQISELDLSSGMLVIVPCAPAPVAAPVLSAPPEPAPESVPEPQPVTPKAAPKRLLPHLKAWLYSPVITVVLILAFVAIAYLRGKAPYGKALTVHKGQLLDTLTLAGTLSPTATIDLRSPAQGSVAEILVRDGQHVTTGDLLYRLQSTSVTANLNRAKLDLVTAESDYNQVVRQIQSANPLREAELQVIRDRISYQEQQSKQDSLNIYAPWDGTVVDLPVSPGDEVREDAPLVWIRPSTRSVEDDPYRAIRLLQAQADLEGKQGNVEQLRLYAPYDGTVERVDATPGQDLGVGDPVMTIHSPGSVPSRSADQQFAVRQASAALNMKAADVANLELRAPADGLLTNFRLTVGETYLPSIVGQVIDNSKMLAIVSIPSRSLLDIVPGAPAAVTLIGSDRTYHGRVTRVAADLRSTTPPFGAEVQLENDGSLRAGMTVQAVIQTKDGTWATVYGWLKPYGQTDIHVRVAGEVEQVLVSDGEMVKQGQLLGKLKNDSVILALEQVRNELHQLESVNITARVPGRVAQVTVQPGTTVKKGDLLAVLSNDLIEASWGASQLAVERAQSESIKSRVAGTVRKVYVTAGQEVHGGTLLVELRNDDLIVQTERSALNLRVSEGNLSALAGGADQQALELARMKVELARMKVELARANLQVAQAEVEELTIRAPMSGTLSLPAGMKRGEPVKQDALIATISDTHTLRMIFNVNETDSVYIENGQSATVAIDSIPDESYEGRVVGLSMEGSVGNGLITYPVTVELDDTHRIWNGMTGTASLELINQEDAIAIPREFVTWVDGAPFVTCLEANKPVKKPITVGSITSTRAEITSGLLDGDVVVVGSGAPSLITRLLTAGEEKSILWLVRMINPAE